MFEQQKMVISACLRACVCACEIVMRKKKYMSEITDSIIIAVVAIYEICCVCPVQSGVEKDIQRKHMLNWVAAQKLIDAVDNMINHARIGLWALKPNMDCSIGASIR